MSTATDTKSSAFKPENSDQAEALKACRTVGAKFARANAGVDGLVVDVARVTHGAYATGILSTERNVGMTQEAYAGMFGVTSKSMVTYWRTLGVAYFGPLGIDPQSTLGRVLRTGKGAQIGDVRTAIEDPKATLDSVQSAVDVYFDESGKRRTNRSVGGNAANGGNGGNGDGAATVAAQSPDTLALAAVAQLDAAFKAEGGVSSETFAVVESRLGDILTREITLRAKAAAKAAKAATPVKRTARKAAAA